MTDEELALTFLGTADEQADHESLDALILELESEVEELQISPYDLERLILREAEHREAQTRYEESQNW